MDKDIEEETIIRLLKELGETDLDNVRDSGWGKLCKRLKEKLDGTPPY